jgi:hypothetical protein
MSRMLMVIIAAIFVTPPEVSAQAYFAEVFLDGGYGRSTQPNQLTALGASVAFPLTPAAVPPLVLEADVQVGRGVQESIHFVDYVVINDYPIIAPLLKTVTWRTHLTGSLLYQRMVHRRFRFFVGSGAGRTFERVREEVREFDPDPGPIYSYGEGSSAPSSRVVLNGRMGMVMTLTSRLLWRIQSGVWVDAKIHRPTVSVRGGLGYRF